MALRLFIAGLIGLVIFIGCGGGGGGGSGLTSSPIGPSIVNSRVFGTLKLDSSVSSLRTEDSTVLANKLFLDSYIFLEESPNYWTRADDQGNFSLEDIPQGTYHLIARVTSLSGRTFKARSSSISFTSDIAERRQDITLAGADIAEAQVRLLIKDLRGVPVGGCKIWLWGEEFTLDPAGFYISPLMPQKTVGTIKVIPPAEKQLATSEIFVNQDVFVKDNLSILGLTLPTSAITNRAPQVNLAVAKYQTSNSAFLRLVGSARDPEGEPLAIEWQTNVSTFSYVSDDYADWAIPSSNASATIYYVAKENGFLYPRLTSNASLEINVASGVISFPNGISIQPVKRLVEISSSATVQISGNTIARFEAMTDFPAGFSLTYNWLVSSGQIISGKNQKEMLWQSPTIGLGGAEISSISVIVEDGVGRAVDNVQVRITSIPQAFVERPVQSSFEPGVIEFSGSARDYLNTQIPAESLSWYLATGTEAFALQKAGAASFSYNFTSQGTYKVALVCVDDEGATGTGTKEISIINAKPVCVISSPADNASFLANTPITFVGNASDFEDGTITDAARIGWRSSLDGFLGSGTSLNVPSLSSGEHKIFLMAIDTEGAVGSSSISVWYDLPARITFLPGHKDVIFTGHPVSFVASGTDSDGTSLDPLLFDWYLEGFPGIWKEGPGFEIASGTIPPGTYNIRVEGVSKLGTAYSSTHAIQIGWSIPEILSPASGTRFDPGVAIAFTGTPDSTGTLALKWFLNNETESFGIGQNSVITPANGYYKVTYSGVDCQGNLKSDEIGVIVERLPVISFVPADNSHIFTARVITFDGISIDTNNTPIPDNRVRWYRDGSYWKDGNKFSVSQGLLSSQLSPGIHQITLEATGPYGAVASRTHTITSGIALADIVTPANNATFLSGTEINFTSVPDSTSEITMRWVANYGLANQVALGEGNNVSYSSLPDGYHNISYFGTDSLGNNSSDSIQINIGKFPVMDFTPGEGSAFFAGRTAVFVGVGTDTVNNIPIQANRMVWFIDGVQKSAGFAVLNVTTSMVEDVGPGLRQLELEGTSTQGAVGRVIKNTYLGVQNASITFPLTNTIIPSATNYNFTGFPDNTGPIEMQWWLDYNEVSPQLLGNGSTLNAVIPDGNHNITYIGTDSAGIVSSATIRVIVSDSPNISFTPGNGSRLFVNQPFTLTVTGNVEEATAKWYLDADTAIFKAGSPVTVNAGELSVGTHQIKVVAENALGVSNETTNSIAYGFDPAQIISPASGSTFAIGSNVGFSGSPASLAPIDMRWYRNDGSGPILMSNSANFSIATIPPGWHTVTYIGTDSAGFASSDEIQILINNPPAITFTPPADGVSSAIIFAGQPFTLSGSGVEAIAPNPPIQADTFKWYRNGTLWKTQSPATVNSGELTVGWHSIAATGVDQYGTVGTATHIVFYGHTPAAIVSPASGSVYNIGATVNFTGSNASPTISMRWFLDGVDTGVTGISYSTALPAGYHRIAYSGSDDAGNTSAMDIMVLMDDAPAMDFMPGEGARYFVNSNAEFEGVGTGSIAAYQVLPSSMKWYLNGSAVADKTGSPANFNAIELLNGNNSLKLTGTDQFGVTGEVTHSFYYGHALADIVSPANGATFNPGANINFAGTPGSSGPITMSWYLNYGMAGETLMGTGANITYSFADRGLKTITYLGTDSAGLMSSKEIEILVNDIPTMTIASPVHNGRYFGGQTLNVSGSGVDPDGNPISIATMVWYRDGTVWKNGIANFTATVLELGTGTLNVRLDGKDAFGTTGTVTNTFQTGIENPRVTSPVSGTKFPLGATVNLAGSPDLSGILNADWYWQGGATIIGSGPSASIATLPRGLHTLLYRSTDDAGTLKTGFTQVILNNDPTVVIDTPLDNGHYFGAQNILLSAHGSDSGGTALPGTSFDWYRNGVLLKADDDNFLATVAQLPAGIHDVSVKVTDDLGSVNGATITVQVGIANPSITSPTTGAKYAIGQTVNFSGSDLTGMINTEWYCTEDNFVFGAGPAASISTFSRGLKTIVYRGTDDAGTLRSGSIQVIVNDAPTVTIDTPVANGYYFGGQSILLSAHGSDSGGTALPSTSFDWYRDGTLFKNDDDSFLATVAELPAGIHDISVKVTDNLGAVNGATLTVEVGIADPSITSPATGAKYAIGQTVNFSGSDLTGMINTEWYCTEDNFVFGAGPTASISTFTRGLKTVVYRGTDDAGTLRSGSIQVIVNDAPTATIDTPANNSKFFAGQSITFGGTGTNSGGLPVSVANYKWYRDTTNFKNGVNTFAATVAELPAGIREIGLVVFDEFNAYGNAASITVEFGIALPAISSPASGTRFNIGQNVNFDGTPDSTGPITMEWYLDYGEVGETLLGNGANINYSFLTRGVKTITYVGTDSAGTTNSKTIQILVNTPPTYTITAPVNNGNYFGGQNINFAGSGVNSAPVPAAIDVASLRWYRDGSLWKTGVDNFAAIVAELPTGTHNIALGGYDDLGTFNSATYSIRVGLGLPQITAPASGTRSDTGASISFTGSPDLSGFITMEWRDGVTLMGTGPTLNTSALSRGWHTISYSGTDDQGSFRSATIMVLVDKLPTFTTLPNIVVPAKFADGPEFPPLSGAYIPIHVASPATLVEFTAAGQDENAVAIPATSIRWYNGASLLETNSTYIQPFETPGSYTYTVTITDSFNQVASASVTFWVWGTETYNSFPGGPAGINALSGPTSLLRQSDSEAFVIDPGNDRIVKLTRLTTGLSTAGDLTAIATETLAASATHDFFDIFVSGTTLYSMGQNPGVNYRIQKWSTNNLQTVVDSYPLIAHGTADTQLNGPAAFCVDNTAIYVSDKGNNRLKKLDINNGVFFSQTRTVDSPNDVTLINPTTLTIVENNVNNRLAQFNNNLTTAASWISDTVTNPVNFVYSTASNNYYVTDPVNRKIHVINSSGDLLYSFGKPGNGLQRGEFNEPYGIAIIQNDLYITDKTNNYILRFRAGSW